MADNIQRNHDAVHSSKIRAQILAIASEEGVSFNQAMKIFYAKD